MSSIIALGGQKLGDHLLVPRFVAGLYNRKPAVPRYIETDSQIILNYIANLPDNEDLNDTLDNC